MKTVILSGGPLRVCGAVDCMVDSDGLQVLRILRRYLPLVPESMLEAVHMPSGVRLTFRTDSPSLEIEIEVLPCGLSDSKVAGIDLLVDGQPATRWALQPRMVQSVRTDGLGTNPKVIDIYLPQIAPVVIKAVRVAPESMVEPDGQRLPRWITYGSSITHCGESDGPATTWPVLVARNCGLELINLGFGSNGMMDACAARSMAETPADCISLKLAVNAMGVHYSERTFVSAGLNMVLTIRDRQPDTPILIVSPICFPDGEASEAPGLNLQRMRQLDEEIVSRMQHYGDIHIAYLDGLQLFGPDDTHLLDESRIHPNAEAQYLIANRFGELAFGPQGFLRVAGT